MKTLLQVTFNSLKKHNACQDGYGRLSKALGGDEIYGLDTPINVLTILKRNGLEDAIWALRATLQSSDKVCRLFAADCAESVLHIFEEKYPDDMRPRNAIQAARDFANGVICWDELMTVEKSLYKLFLKSHGMDKHLKDFVIDTIIAIWGNVWYLRRIDDGVYDKLISFLL